MPKVANVDAVVHAVHAVRAFRAVRAVHDDTAGVDVTDDVGGAQRSRRPAFQW
jgi:hypothetical protein